MEGDGREAAVVEGRTHYSGSQAGDGAFGLAWPNGLGISMLACFAKKWKLGFLFLLDPEATSGSGTMIIDPDPELLEYTKV